MIRSEKLAVVGQLAAGVAHEIRNPLTSLKGFTQLLKTKFGSDPPYYLDVMLEELERINFIVNEFMTFAKPHLTLYNTAPVEKLLQNVLAILEPQLVPSDINVVLKYEANLPLIYCDKNQLKHVFLNLIKNAIEAMQDGGEVLINVKQTHPDHIQIQIIDQGVGIPDDIIRHIADPFFTTKETGTGLGLVVSYRIIEEHKGTIQISSKKNKGTTISITLPVAKQKE